MATPIYDTEYEEKVQKLNDILLGPCTTETKEQFWKARALGIDLKFNMLQKSKFGGDWFTYFTGDGELEYYTDLTFLLDGTTNIDNGLIDAVLTYKLAKQQCTLNIGELLDSAGLSQITTDINMALKHILQNERYWPFPNYVTRRFTVLKNCKNAENTVRYAAKHGWIFKYLDKVCTDVILFRYEQLNGVDMDLRSKFNYIPKKIYQKQILRSFKLADICIHSLK